MSDNDPVYLAYTHSRDPLRRMTAHPTREAAEAALAFQGRTVTVLVTEDRHWCRNVVVYLSRARAEQALIDLLDNEYGERVGTADAAIGRLTEMHGWTICLDDVEVQP